MPDDQDKVYQEGLNAGAAGHPVTVCPYGERTKNGKTWYEGFRHGRDYLEAFGGSAPFAVGFKPRGGAR